MYPLPPRIGRYEIKSLIGSGGMGSLYLARDTNPNTNRLVALKLLNTNIDSPELRERFAREARALAALNHPSIVDIYDSGEFRGSPYIVMEYVRGETLAEKIKRQAPMSLVQKLKLMMELCSGLAHAHDAGIIHRDIKPANLMVDLQGRLKILDFGIARVTEGTMTRVGLQMTQLNMRIGTPGYMSPEQIEGAEIDRRSDIFAAGAVFYELLAYREAFTGATTRQIENKVLQSQPTPLTSVIEGLDPQIEAIVLRALQKDPAQRYQDATAFEEALEQQRWRLGPAHTPVPTPRPTPVPGSGRSGRDSRADIAHQRATLMYDEGAYEAARRFVIEALAEDPTHADARALLQRLDPNRWEPAAFSSPTPPPATEALTAVASDDEPYAGAAPTVVSTGSRGSRQHVSGAAQGLPNRHGRTLQIAAIVGAILLVVGTAAGFWWWLGSSGVPLTVTRPVGGTLIVGGIKCGSSGSACFAEFDKDEIVEITYTADDGFVFEGFTGDCAPTGRMIMSAPRACGATFTKAVAPPPQALVRALRVSPSAGGSVIAPGIRCGTVGGDCSEDYPDGQSVKLIAQADQGFRFGRFTGDCTRNGQVEMTAARECGAIFVSVAAGGGKPSATPPPTTVTAGGGRTSAPPPSLPPVTAEPPPITTPTTPVGVPPSGGGSRAGGGTVGPPPVEVEALTMEQEAKNEIKKILEQYRLAYEDLDIQKIRQVFPQAPSALEQYFRQFKGVEYKFTGEIEYIEMNQLLGTAIVKVPVSMVSIGKVGGDQAPAEGRHLFNMERKGSRWFIAKMTFEPKGRS